MENAQITGRRRVFRLLCASRSWINEWMNEEKGFPLLGLPAYFFRDSLFSMEMMANCPKVVALMVVMIDWIATIYYNCLVHYNCSWMWMEEVIPPSCELSVRQIQEISTKSHKNSSKILIKWSLNHGKTWKNMENHCINGGFF